MAEPIDPNTPGAPGAPGDGNGENSRNIDRDMTPLASTQKFNALAVGSLVAAGFVFVMWRAGVFSTEQAADPTPKTPAVPAQQAPPLPRPTVAVAPPPPVYTPPHPPPTANVMDAEAERLLLLKVRGLQKQMFERRRSKMLVVSDPSAAPPAALPAALSS